MKKLLLILVILLGIAVFAGCSITFTAPDCCPPVTPPPVVEDCYLVLKAGYWVWGGVYADDKFVGYIDFETNPIVIIDLACGTWVRIYIIDPCGWKSHTETIFINPGRNDLVFPYIPQDRFPRLRPL